MNKLPTNSEGVVTLMDNRKKINAAIDVFEW